MSESVLAPASIPQEQCLNSTSNVTLYGGAAGSGKTFALLITALKFMQYPRGTGIIFRRTSAELRAGGGIWEEAINMYSNLYGDLLKIDNTDLVITFPNKAKLKFSHMQYEKDAYSHKGGQYSFVAFDEATDFTETQVTFLMSRMRNANVSHEPQMFLTTNPDYHSFLRHWIQDFYLDENTGIPIDEKSNIERFFVKNGDKMEWYDSRKEAEEIYGSTKASGIRSFRFIRANIFDNPYYRDSEYLSNLMSLNEVQKNIMLYGSWLAREAQGGYWKREKVNIVDRPPLNPTKRVLAVDFAFTEKSSANRDPDSTAFVLMSKDKNNVYTVENVVTMQQRVHVVEEMLFEIAEKVGRETLICIPQDPNAQAGAYARDLQRRLSEKGFTCRLQKPVKSKLVRFQPFASVTEAGFVNVVDGAWNKEYFDQLEIFDGAGRYHDDMVDATSDAFFMLNKEVALPQFTLPDFSVKSQFGYQQVSLPTEFNNSLPIGFN